MYQVIRRDGTVVTFDTDKITRAIHQECEAEHELDKSIIQIIALFCGDPSMDISYVEDALYELEERRLEIRNSRKKMNLILQSILRIAWLRRNRRTDRSNTSAVSDAMLMTIPTPPTFVAANRSLQKWGIVYGATA